MHSRIKQSSSLLDAPWGWCGATSTIRHLDASHKSGDKVAPASTYSQNKLNPGNKRTGWSQPRWHRFLQELLAWPWPSSPARSLLISLPQPCTREGVWKEMSPPPRQSPHQRLPIESGRRTGRAGLLLVLSGESFGELVSLRCREGGEGSPCSSQGPSLGAADGRRSWSQAHGPSCQSER